MLMNSNESLDKKLQQKLFVKNSEVGGKLSKCQQRVSGFELLRGKHFCTLYDIHMHVLI